ncbi:MAG: hypothetical protein LBK08_09585 [Treponema sp.]|jgi:hypothetical protein|nr:hypothetical protein [Treponema sp.]
MTITTSEKKLVWNLLFSLRNCFNNDGTLSYEYYQNVVLVELTKEEKALFDDLIQNKLLKKA